MADSLDATTPLAVWLYEIDRAGSRARPLRDGGDGRCQGGEQFGKKLGRRARRARRAVAPDQERKSRSHAATLQR